MKRDNKANQGVVDASSRLRVKKEILRDLSAADLAQVSGGGKKKCNYTIVK